MPDRWVNPVGWTLGAVALSTDPGDAAGSASSSTTSPPDPFDLDREGDGWGCESG
jgi:hypothetical protein